MVGVVDAGEDFWVIERVNNADTPTRLLALSLSLSLTLPVALFSRQDSDCADFGRLLVFALKPVTATLLELLLLLLLQLL